ncbi:hypothetical protein BdWA1_001381 [Babesia duncani]|uniref:Uncharacterized protein n=1 Tax=Babesia duncani TaxID=323732 RepID=A0AAD9UQZ9_9APIC|nr:hypothetical protein BdWA1_001381 [Babesia duncani]
MCEAAAIDPNDNKTLLAEQLQASDPLVESHLKRLGLAYEHFATKIDTRLGRLVKVIDKFQNTLDLVRPLKKNLETQMSILESLETNVEQCRQYVTVEAHASLLDALEQQRQTEEKLTRVHELMETLSLGTNVNAKVLDCDSILQGANRLINSKEHCLELQARPGLENSQLLSEALTNIESSLNVVIEAALAHLVSTFTQNSDEMIDVLSDVCVTTESEPSVLKLIGLLSQRPHYLDHFFQRAQDALKQALQKRLVSQSSMHATSVGDVFLFLQIVTSLAKSCIVGLYYRANLEPESVLNQVPIVSALQLLNAITGSLVEPLESELEQRMPMEDVWNHELICDAFRAIQWCGFYKTKINDILHASPSSTPNSARQTQSFQIEGWTLVNGMDAIYNRWRFKFHDEIIRHLKEQLQANGTSVKYTLDDVCQLVLALQDIQKDYIDSFVLSELIGAIVDTSLEFCSSVSDACEGLWRLVPLETLVKCNNAPESTRELVNEQIEMAYKVYLHAASTQLVKNFNVSDCVSIDKETLEPQINSNVEKDKEQLSKRIKEIVYSARLESEFSGTMQMLLLQYKFKKTSKALFKFLAALHDAACGHDEKMLKFVKDYQELVD